MGKKRRYIQRARKFAQKYFKILDGFDGNADDSEIEEYTAFIDTVVVADNENQTVTLTGRVLGYASNVTDDGVEYSLDGAAFVAVDAAITDNDSGDIDEFTFSVNPAPAGPDSLSVGSHTVVVRPKGVTDAQRNKKASFTVRENKITVDTTKFTDDGAGNINLSTAEIFSAGKIKAGSATGVSEDSNGYKIEAALVDGSNLTPLTVAASVANPDLADLAALLATESVLDLGSALAAPGGTVRLTVTPKDSNDSLLTESATTFDVPVTA